MTMTLRNGHNLHTAFRHIDLGDGGIRSILYIIRIYFPSRADGIAHFLEMFCRIPHTRIILVVVHEMQIFELHYVHV